MKQLEENNRSRSWEKENAPRKQAYAALVENGAYEEAMSGNALDWNEVACYETAVAEIASLIKVMPVNDGTAIGE